MRGSKPGERRGGRTKETPNKATAGVREALAKLAQGNVGKVQAWLDRTAKKDPACALDLYLRMLEHHVPKLARSEISGPEGDAQKAVFRIIEVPAKDVSKKEAIGYGLKMQEALKKAE